MENEIFAEELNDFESYSDVDFNEDGINESILTELDTDSDGKVDLMNFTEDKDNDGEIDKQLNTFDNDGDGEVDLIHFTEDIDNDGEIDREITAKDEDGDGEYDVFKVAQDLDSDGEIDKEIIAYDKDSDGEFDEVQFKEDFDSNGEFDKETIAYDRDSNGEYDEYKVVKNSESNQKDNNYSMIGNPNFDVVEVIEVSEFNQEDDNIDIIGDPEDDMEHWRMQEHPDTCAIVAQEFILDDIGEDYGIDFSEEQLREQAIENGWYIPGGGTPMNDVGKLLEANGVEVETDSGYTLEDIENKLEDGQKIIVGIDSDEIWYSEDDFDDSMYESLGMPGQGANHAVQVIGIDKTDPDNPVVILNDPGTPNGKGLRVPADEFADAWEDSDYFMMSTTGKVIA